MLYTKDSARWRVCLLALCMSTASFYEVQDPGSSGALHLGTASDPEKQPCSLRLVLRLRLLKLANSLTRALMD